MKKLTNLSLFSFFILSVGILISSCSSDENKPSEIENNDSEKIDDLEILFIGNSHTFYNSGIPYHLESFRKNENPNYETYIKESAFSGFSLADHVNSTATLDQINERDWDFIILQENTFVAANERESTLAALTQFKDILRNKRARKLLFMTWEYKDEPEMYLKITDTYNQGKLTIGAQVVPVGDLWRKVNYDLPNINLYNEDGFHPSPQGTFLAAAMFYKKIYEKNPADNTYTAGLEIEVANYLKTKVNEYN